MELKMEEINLQIKNRMENIREFLDKIDNEERSIRRLIDQKIKKSENKVRR